MGARGPKLGTEENGLLVTIAGVCILIPMFLVGSLFTSGSSKVNHESKDVKEYYQKTSRELGVTVEELRTAVDIAFHEQWRGQGKDGKLKNLNIGKAKGDELTR